jgi:DNA-binding transcriptional LysR family regulator
VKDSTDQFISSRFKTRQLQLLVHLDEHRSVLHAANASHITQPAASKLLRELEETLGVELFVRHTRGVEPTWYGEILVRHARSALEELKHAFDEVSALRSGLSGQAAIGTVITSATDLVPRAVATLKQRFPQVSVSIEMDFSEPLLQRLQDGELDMVIARMHNPRVLTELHFEPLGEALHAMVGRAGHPLSRRRGLTWNELTPQTWVIGPRGNVLRDRISLLLLERGLEMPKQLVETSSLPVITSLLEISDMVAPLPTDVVRRYCDSGALVILPIRLDLQLGPAGIVTRRNQKLSPGALTMLNVLREVAAQPTVPVVAAKQVRSRRKSG